MLEIVFAGLLEADRPHLERGKDDVEPQRTSNKVESHLKSKGLLLLSIVDRVEIHQRQFSQLLRSHLRQHGNDHYYTTIDDMMTQ